MTKHRSDMDDRHGMWRGTPGAASPSWRGGRFFTYLGGDMPTKCLAEIDPGLWKLFVDRLRRKGIRFTDRDARLLNVAALLIGDELSAMGHPMGVSPEEREKGLESIIRWLVAMVRKLVERSGIQL